MVGSTQCSCTALNAVRKGHGMSRLEDETCEYCDQPAVVKIQHKPCCRTHIDTAMAEVGKVVRRVRQLAQDLSRRQDADDDRA